MKPISGKSIYSWILVFIQFICLLFLFVTGPVIAKKPFYLTVEIISIVLGIWSAFLMDPLTINIFPDVRKNASLVKYGPYKYIRHPMYLAVILLSLSLLLEKFNAFRLVAVFVLIADLLIKIQFEEKKLIEKYPTYVEYQKKTKKIIPNFY